MREVRVEEIIETVARLCQEANFLLGTDLEESLRRSLELEESPVGRACLTGLIENAEIARMERVPICQDTGMAVVFVEYGQQVTLGEGDLSAAVNEGVRRGYREGYLRKSVVKDPLDRVNTGIILRRLFIPELYPGTGSGLASPPRVSAVKI